ncbi:hypothetical protein LPJ59_002680 [Coemansia sp. RSA 2399]|nr:hypothetical protein LPJ59_002680 [Coemansia sp. RSA 2399]
MGYYLILDAAPSSVSSTAVSLAGSLLSVLGTAFVILNLCILRRRRRQQQQRENKTRKEWEPRHYLILTLCTVNLVSSVAALLSGGVYLVYGRIPSQAGCTAGGMITYWAQQADIMCIVFIALVVYASQFQKAQWMAGKYWVQSSRAPVIGIVVLLPLVATVVVQIIWRFRSEELAYCWIPRVPVYARWVAIDAWRAMLVCALGLVYARIAVARAAAQRRGARRLEPCVEVRRSAIDSAASSAKLRKEGEEEGGGGGLWSQSVHNMHRWARSVVLARSNVVTDQRHGNSANHAAPRCYYESFKRSLLSLITRRFVITTDIPSPTLSHGIFDNICKSSKYGEKGKEEEDDDDEDVFLRSASATQYDRSCCIIDTGSSSSRQFNGTIAKREADGVSIDTMTVKHGLRRWCSAVSRMLRTPKSSRLAAEEDEEGPIVPGYTLRRSHTAPILSAKQMNLGSEFARPRMPARAHACRPTSVLDPTMTLISSGSGTAAAAAAAVTPPVRYACDSVFDYEYGIDVDGSVSDGVSAMDPVPVFPKRMDLGIHTAYPPQRLSIYTFREDAAGHRESSVMPRLPSKRSSSSSSSRIRIRSSVRGAMELSSMEEEGSWMAAVEKCRSTRLHSANGKLSRLYVYPLAYVAVWLPALVYCVMSTYVYHRAFEANGGFFSSFHAKRAVHLADLPAHWTQPHNMHRAWPYYAAATHGVAGSARLSWLAVLQALHLLGGFVNAVLFWLTE